ncbi:MAG: hypothetical protein HZC02_02390 [Candidatus Levybacteria bacterium]|nr:hypothetical protein [Candidatus Levybacteria bacterium]
MPRSRLNQRQARQAKRNIIIIALGSCVLLALFLIFGTNLLVKFSLLVERESATAQEQVDTFVAPPSLDYIADATNSAEIDITGSGESDGYIKLFVNGKQVKKADIQSDNTFSFRRIKLTPGENSIKAKFVNKDNKESKFSETTIITYSNKAPELSIISPNDGQSFNKDHNPLKITGKTDQNVKVTVNDFWAVVDGQGNFYYNLSLKGGDNEIRVQAIDEAGNKAEKTLKVSFAE